LVHQETEVNTLMKRFGLILLALMVLATLPAKAATEVNVGIGISFGPPAIPIYAQPPAPAPNYIWTPGYWAWGPNGYYWVPGTWVAAPAPGLVWTPGYWSFDNGAYYWNAGYWAPQVGFYGGIDYGFGYYGDGYVGGEWQGPVYRYNTAVTNVNRTIIRNVYVDKTVIVNNINRVSYNGGPNGVDARPTLHDEWVEHMMHHDPATETQVHHQVAAADNREFLARVNHGDPRVAAVDHPLTSESRLPTTENRPPATEHRSPSTENRPHTVTEPPTRHVEEQQPVSTVHHNAPPQATTVQNEPAHARPPTHEQHVPAHPPVEEHHNTVTRKPAPHPHATGKPQQ
jgi:WXXGXW repeat (2 copies)